VVGKKKTKSAPRKASRTATKQTKRDAAPNTAKPESKNSVAANKQRRIGILAVQGDFAAHAAMLRSLGAEPVEVRTVGDLHGLDGMILPGGESTTQLQFLREEGLFQAIRDFASQGRPVFGTCAGAILLASRVENPAQDSLGLLDMTVLRNGYGRQLASDVFFEPTALKKGPLEMVFIRGPIIENIGKGIDVLASHQGKPALVQNGNILASTFHPELTDDATVHQYFLGLADQHVAKSAAR
jgi:pyridoxal 5'-phosphate synthase pdxT subunit